MTFFFIHKTVQCFLHSLIQVKPGIKMNDQHVHFLKTLTCGEFGRFLLLFEPFLCVYYE